MKLQYCDIRGMMLVCERRCILSFGDVRNCDEFHHFTPCMEYLLFSPFTDQLVSTQFVAWTLSHLSLESLVKRTGLKSTCCSRWSNSLVSFIKFKPNFSHLETTSKEVLFLDPDPLASKDYEHSALSLDMEHLSNIADTIT